MLEKEPLVYPNRYRYIVDPGIPNRQLWAIGMIVVQWSMTETFIDIHVRQLIGSDESTLERYKKRRGFQQTIIMWESQIETKLDEPQRSHFLSLIPKIKQLSSQRDELMHRTWGGSFDPDDPKADGGLLPLKPTDKISSKPGRMPFSWKPTFASLRRIATEISQINLRLALATSKPDTPDGNANI